jgi:hypothetical protein
MVFRSAWIPAPPPESLPATVNTTGFESGAACRVMVSSCRTGGKDLTGAPWPRLAVALYLRAHHLDDRSP